MEKPTGLLKKIIENLHLINSVEGDYSPIEKDIILQHLRSVYMIVLNAPTNEDATRSSISFEEENLEKTVEEKIEEPKLPIQELPVSESPTNEEPELSLQEELELKIQEEKSSASPPPNLPQTDDILEFIPQEKQPTVLSIPFEEKPMPTEEKSTLFERKPTAIEEKPVDEKPIEEKPAPIEEKVTLAKSAKKSLNDLLMERKEDNSLGTKLQQSKIDDLSKAISINDKFLFIRELFNNKGEEFSAAIQKLNDCNNIEEAFELVEMLKRYYFWDTTAAPYLSLCDLVRRKYT